MSGVFSEDQRNDRPCFRPKPYKSKASHFCSSSFLEFLKAVYFSKPSILTARNYISSTEYQFLSTVCSQEPFRMFSLGDEQFRTSFFWGVTFSHLFVWDRKETLNEIPLRRVLEKAGKKKIIRIWKKGDIKARSGCMVLARLLGTKEPKQASFILRSKPQKNNC